MSELIKLRGSDWIFSALWAASSTTTSAVALSSTSIAGSSSSSQSGCPLSIPVTFIFRDSWPFKALVTNEGGFVERLIMEAVDFKRPGIDGDGLMKTLRASLVEFQNR
jgi:hypothetical protein